MKCSPHWQPKLIARIELEIDDIACRLGERWEQIEKTVEALVTYSTELQFRGNNPSFTWKDDLKKSLAYLMDELSKWTDAQTEIGLVKTAAKFRKPLLDIEKATARCKYDLQAHLINTFKK